MAGLNRKGSQDEVSATFPPTAGTALLTEEHGDYGAGNRPPSPQEAYRRSVMEPSTALGFPSGVDDAYHAAADWDQPAKTRLKRAQNKISCMRHYRWTVPVAVAAALLCVGKFVLSLDQKGIDQLTHLSDPTQKILVGVNVTAAVAQLLAAAHVNLAGFRRKRPERSVGVLSEYSTNCLVRAFQKAGAAENDKKTSFACLAAVLFSALTAALTMKSEALPNRELPCVLLCAAYLTLTFFATWAVGRGFAPTQSSELSAHGDVLQGASEGSQGSQASAHSMKSAGMLHHNLGKFPPDAYQAPEYADDEPKDVDDERKDPDVVVSNPVAQVTFGSAATAPKVTAASNTSADRAL